MKVGLDAAYKQESIFDADKFKMKMGEKARICVLGSDAIDMHPVHYLTLSSSDWKLNGYFFCLGDYLKIFGDPTHPGSGSGSDPEGCEFCRHGARDSAIGLVGRRFACNIIKYLTLSDGKLRPLGVDAGGFPVVSIDTLAWVFGNDKYSRLLALKDSYGDLRKIDLLVECTGEKFQKMTIDPCNPKEAQWFQRSQQAAAALLQQFRGDMYPDLSELIGRKVDAAKASELVKQALGLAPSATSTSATLPPVASMQDMQALLDSSPTTVAPVAQQHIPLAPGNTVMEKANPFAPAPPAPSVTTYIPPPPPPVTVAVAPPPPPVVAPAPPPVVAPAPPPVVAPAPPPVVPATVAPQVTQQPPQPTGAASFEDLLKM